MTSSAIGFFEIGVSPIGGTTDAVDPFAQISLQNTIPAFPYKEYDDDDDLQAMFNAYNVLAQIYVDWFNQINLPIYTGLEGALLDWVGQGLYGKIRPTLYSNTPYVFGPLNTFSLNQHGPNAGGVINNITDIAVTDDDIYKRVITWHFYKGDGKQINAQWVRRRVLRFLYGANGGDYNAPSQNVSVMIGGGYISITICSAITASQGSVSLNQWGLNRIGCNAGGNTTLATFNVPFVASMLVEGISTGALEMPSQLNVAVRIGVLGVP